MNTKEYKMTPKLREQIDALIRPILKEHGTAVECAEEFDHRYTSREKTDTKAGWGAYERHLLTDGHIVYVSLDSMTANYSPKPAKKDGAAYRRYLKRQRRHEKELAKMEAEAPVKVKAKTTKKAKRTPKEASTEELLAVSDLHKPTGLKGETNVVKPTAAPKATKKVHDPLQVRSAEPVA